MKSDLPWDEGILINEAQAALAIKSSFPDFPLRKIKFLKSGWDSSAFNVNGSHIFRFPKRREVEARLLGEIQVLTRLAPNSPISVPSHSFIGTRSADYPFLFVGYSLIGGQSQTEVQAKLLVSDVYRLVKLLNVLHFLPPEDFPDVLPDDRAAHDEFLKQQSLLEGISRLTKIDPDLSQQIQNFFDTFDLQVLNQDFQPSLIHNDLLPEHFLMADDSIISGIIDWGDVAIGDPAVDFAGIGYSFGMDTLHSVIRESGRLDSNRISNCAILFSAAAALSDIWYGEQVGEPQRVKFALNALKDLTRKTP